MSSVSSSTQASSLIQSSTGLGSGINIGSIVSQLVTAEGQGTYDRINRQEAAISTHLSGIGTLKSALSTFQAAVSKLQTGSIFQTNAATSSNSDILTVTPGTGSVAANHDIEVLQLATAQSSISNAEFANAAATVGTGKLTFTSTSGASFNVDINSANNSLAGVRDAINNAVGNTSVSASIVNVDSGNGTGTVSKLVLTAKQTGTANAFSVSGVDSDLNNTDTNGLSQLFSGNLSNQATATQASITKAGFANGAAVVGTGTLSFANASGSTFNVTIDNTNNSLTGIRDAINNAAGNTLVSASVISVNNASGSGTVSKLVLTSKQPGSAGAVTVSGVDGDANNTDAAGLSQLFSANLNQTTATDAIINVDGQKATRSTNAMSDVLQGVTLNLQSAAVGTKVNVGVTLDTATITGAINGFVSAYNALHSTTKSLQSYGGVGGTNGDLFGDPTVEYVSSQMRSLSTSVVSSLNGGYNSLAMIGVNIDQNGVMSLDSTQLNKALSSNVQSVSNVFSAVDGVATRLKTSLTAVLQSGGSLDTQTNSLNSAMTALEKERLNEQSYLDNYQKTLQKQYNAMDSLVGKYNSTSSFLTSWIAKGG